MSKKKILVTGATGFVGKALTDHLQAIGEETVGLSLSSGDDVRNPRCFDGHVDKGIGVVFHLAAKTYVPESWKTPDDFYRTNTLGTLNVLEFCRKSGARMIYLSGYVYGSPQYLPIDENHPVQPNNPYAHSKWCGEEICRFYSRYCRVRTSILRPSNLYGPGQADHFLIPTIIDQFKNGQEVVVRDCTPKRDFLHVRDFLEACSVILRHQELDQTYNVSAGVSVSVAEIIGLISEISGTSVRWRDLGQVRPNEIPDTRMSSLLVQQGFWKPKISLQDGLRGLLD
jgi:nucleoside-diphosphate-sugar epimerase